MSNHAANFYKGLSESIQQAISRIKPFRAIVHDVLPTGVQIKELGADTPLDEPYARLSGAAVTADDDVAVIMMGDRPFILGKIQRGTSDGETYNFPVWIEATDNDAFLVSKSDGTELFRVDTDTPSFVSLMNGVAINGFTGEDRSGLGTFAIDSATGDARFNNVTATTINSPVVTTGAQSVSDTGSTTSTATYSTAMTSNIVLPTGTWRVFAIGGAEFIHSASGTVNVHVIIGGNAGTARGVSVSSTVYGTIIDNNEIGGLSGTVAVAVQFKSSTAGTTTCKAPWLYAIAVRTA